MMVPRGRLDWWTYTNLDTWILFVQMWWKPPKILPIGSMVLVYMLTNIWGILMVNVTIYSIHGSYGIWWSRSIFLTIFVGRLKHRISPFCCGLPEDGTIFDLYFYQEVTMMCRLNILILFDFNLSFVSFDFQTALMLEEPWDIHIIPKIYQVY